jgi:AraC family transcriptional regulator, transcriptional activator of pobA
VRMKDHLNVILEDYRKAFKNRYKTRGIVELDEGGGVSFKWVLLRLEEVVGALGFSTPPFRHSKYTIIPVKNRTMMVVPNRTITATTYSENIRGYHLSVNLDFFLQEHFPRYHLLQLNLLKQHVTPFAYATPTQGKQLTEIFERLIEERDQNRKNKQQMIALKILELIIVCDRQLKLEEGKSSNGNQPLIVNYMNAVQEHFKKQHATNYYASVLNVHPNSLNAAVKRYMGMSAKAVITSRLLNEAKSLLHLTGLSVKEVAYELGFQSPSHFFRFFKQHSGYSPLAYRKNMEK